VGYVPHLTIKEIFYKHHCLGFRGNWVSKIQEYELEVKPTKLVRGQGLGWMLGEGNEQALDIIC
jgi:hypothetical protein